MHTQAFFLSFGLMAALQGVSSVPMPAGPAQGGRNSQISRILRGTGLRGMNAAQLNTLISNLSAEGLTLGCDAGAGAGAGADAGEGAAGGKGAGEEAAAGEGEGEGSKFRLPLW